MYHLWFGGVDLQKQSTFVRIFSLHRTLFGLLNDTAMGGLILLFDDIVSEDASVEGFLCISARWYDRPVQGRIIEGTAFIATNTVPVIHVLYIWPLMGRLVMITTIRKLCHHNFQNGMSLAQY